jgi:hypothetical protein
MELLQVNRTALLSFRLGLCSLLAGPLSGIPAILLGWRGLNQIRRNVGGSGGKRVAQFGIAAGLLGSVIVPTLSYFVYAQVFWPDERIRVNRFFRELEAERLYERQDGMWPTLRALAPESVYRAADRNWPPNPWLVRLSTGGLAMRLPSGAAVNQRTLRDIARPIIAIGRPAVPHLLPWVMHKEEYIRFVAIDALEQITSEKAEISHYDAPWEQEARRANAIERWKEWYENNPGTR